ncbi:MAG: Non-reducing end beta-L-arabinofuranosidase [Planctomycetes bacterium ADurb.Bin126]|nr:MAG: Non-reducing end beta-L-arabinofuranosidase [Planctomycetes bacterium ADurb.Bin126]HQL72629.1 glycoside hydrolase family 127 protein [Phycisphaerae bacterium]
MIKLSLRSLAVIWLFAASASTADKPAEQQANLALVAEPSTSFVSGHETLAAVNDGHTPRHSDDKKHGAYGNWNRQGTQWVQYDWSQPVRINRIDVYWFDDHRGVRLPKACRLAWWDGRKFVPVANAKGLGLAANTFNTTTFDEVATTRLRLEMDSNNASTGILEWRVYDSGNSPNFAPVVEAGVDRVAILGCMTHLAGHARDDGKPKPVHLHWAKRSGPGEVTFDDPAAAQTAAGFSASGRYVLTLTADDGALKAADTVRVDVETMPAAAHLEPVGPVRYKLTSPLWRQRAKAMIVNWIPYCCTKMSDPEMREGGIINFVEAGNKLAGRPHKPQKGAVFANGWVYNTLEAMCLAQMLDPDGDVEIQAAQKKMREVIDDWAPKMLSAQEPDGYLQTAYTLSGRKRWTNKHDHEGYLIGYFIEACIAHYEMTGRKDDRMYQAARRAADCWVANIGPAPRKSWYDGHQELKIALVRLARLVEQVEGAGKGRPYVELAAFLLSCRGEGDEYDQSHAPAIRQYEAVGHAVRAVYQYAGMADLAMQTRDPEVLGATRSIWNNLVHRKYYVTGGAGSGETSEGFGKDFSLPHHAYCESCAGCGELLFQHRMNLLYREAKYADLYEETLYNAILGGIDLEGQNFTYTNPLDSSHGRYKWHVCPCCVGNLPRTLLQLPAWTYARASDGLYVNLFIGSEATIDRVAGTNVKVTQETDYPWSGNVKITVNPERPTSFKLRIRMPSRAVSELYKAEPACDGIVSVALNGLPCTQPTRDGYAVFDRTWRAGDRVELVLPMRAQKVTCDEKVVANRGRVALRVGPLIYNVEAVDNDNNLDRPLARDCELTTKHREDLLGGVTVIQGKFADGKPLLAIPNYARNNRGGRSVVWIKDQ